MEDVHCRADPIEVVQPGSHAYPMRGDAWRSLVSERDGFCEGNAFWGLTSGQKNAVLRRGPLAAATKLLVCVRVVVMKVSPSEEQQRGPEGDPVPGEYPETVPGHIG